MKNKLEVGEYYQYIDCSCIMKINKIEVDFIFYSLVQKSSSCTSAWDEEDKEENCDRKIIEAELEKGSIVKLPKLKRMLLFKED